MAINFDFLNKFLFSGHLDYPFKSYGPKQVRLISTHPWACAKGCFDPVGGAAFQPIVSKSLHSTVCQHTALVFFFFYQALLSTVHYESSIEGLGTAFVCLLSHTNPPSRLTHSAFQLPPPGRTYGSPTYEE